MSLIAIISMLIVNRRSFFPLAKNWGKHILLISGIKSKIIGKEKLNDGESYIFCVNHSSMMDIPILLASIKHNFRIIYKKELDKIPIFGWGLNLSPFIAIKRSNARDSMAGIEEAIESIRSGESVVIFPEGTRSDDGKLGEFKRGAFMLASRSGKKIVPVTVIGSAKVLPNKKFLVKSGIVDIIISDPIEYHGSSKVDEMNLMKQVYIIINENLSKA